MSRFRISSFVTIVLLAVGVPKTDAQTVEDRALLDWPVMNAIANEASGERALQHVLELVPYQRVRPLSEYGPDAHFRESRVTHDLARAYGFSDVSIETYPRDNRDYQPTFGQLWVEGPLPRKLFDIYDTPVALAGGSQSGDVTAELVHVGSGDRAEDYEGLEVRGKIVLGSARAGTLQRLAVFERGAVGVLSTSAVYPVDQPDAIVSTSIQGTSPDGQPGGFGWSISPRVGQELAARIASGEVVTLRSVVEGHEVPGELEVVHATIPGDGSTDQVVFVSAHVFEGYIKQGANDDNSGVGLTLEIGRAYLQLIQAGVLPAPKRTIHFLWVPEFSGTYAWLDAHPDIQAAAIADLNFDMEGIRLATAGSFWVLHRTPDSFPSFLNDVCQSFLESVAESNRERARFRALAYGFTWPVLSQNGSRDPFYFSVDKHYGSSDHVAFLQRGIPAVMFITWPDRWYHTSQDTPDKLDPTQFRRAAVVGIGSLAVLASGGDALAYRVVNESLGRGTERLGANQRKGLGYLADAGTGEELVAAYKEAKNAVRHQADVEKAVVRSASVLFDEPSAGLTSLKPFEGLIDRRAQQLQSEITASFRMAAGLLDVPTKEPAASPEEVRAGRTAVELLRAMGRGQSSGLDEADRAALARVPQHMVSELRTLLETKRTVMEIRDFLAGEFDPLPLDDLLGYLRVQEKTGAIRLTER